MGFEGLEFSDFATLEFEGLEFENVEFESLDFERLEFESLEFSLCVVSSFLEFAPLALEKLMFIHSPQPPSKKMR